MDIQEFQKYRENKIHTEDNFPYNTYLCSIPLDFPCVPIHWHDEIELIVIQKGRGTVLVDFNRYLVSAGDIVVVLPGHLHSIDQAFEDSMEYENILFRSDLLFSRTEDICTSAYLRPLITGNLPVDCHIHPGLCYYEEFSHVIQSIDLLCQKRPVGYQLAVKGHLFQLFFLLLSSQTKKAPSKTERKSLEKIKFIIHYVEEHYSEPITVEQMASLCYYSSSHFMKFFKTHMGVSFIQYLNDYRLTMARRLLATCTYSVLEVAQQTGFENLSYFNRLFKRKYGITPKQLR